MSSKFFFLFIYFLQILLTSANTIHKIEGRLLKILRADAGFESSEERERYGRNYGQNYGPNLSFQPTTPASIFGFLSPQTPPSSYVNQYGTNNQNDPRFNKGFESSEERRRNGQNYGQNYGPNLSFQPTTPASIFGFLSPQTPPSSYGNQYGTNNQNDPRYNQGQPNDNRQFQVPQNSIGYNNFNQNEPTTPGFPFNLFATTTTTTTTPAPFPLNLFQQAPTQTPSNLQLPSTLGFPFNLLPTTATTTPLPFPLNLIPTVPSLLPSVPYPLNLLLPTTASPFPFNLIG